MTAPLASAHGDRVGAGSDARSLGKGAWVSWGSLWVPDTRFLLLLPLEPQVLLVSAFFLKELQFCHQSSFFTISDPLKVCVLILKCLTL